MSPEEMRSFCESIRPYQLSVCVRLKNGTEVLVGKIAGVSADRFQLEVAETGPQSLRFAWVAKISAA